MAVTNPLAFPDFLQRLADTVEELHRRLLDDMHTPGCSGKGTNCCIAASGGSNSKLLEDIDKLVKASSNLGKEIRQWSGHTQTQLDKMSPARKCDVVIRFLQSLPLSGRMDAYNILAAEETRRPGGIRISLDNSFGGATPAQTARGDE